MNEEKNVNEGSDAGKTGNRIGSGSPICSVACRRGFLAAVLTLPFVKPLFVRKRQAVAHKLVDGKWVQVTSLEHGEPVKRIRPRSLATGEMLESVDIDVVNHPFIKSAVPISADELQAVSFPRQL